MNNFFLKFSEFSMVPVIVEACASYANNIKLSKDKIKDIELCVDEAINNAISYGDTRSSINPNIELYMEVENDELVISIIDYGLPGDFEETLKNNEKWGCEIIESLMDKYDVINLGENGRKQEMRLSFDNDLKSNEITSENKDESICHGPFTYRIMNKSDALEVCRGIYRVYGFSYFITENYYPEFFEKMIDEGKLYGFIAEDPKGNHAGFVAIKKLDNLPGVWEACAGYTIKKYRGNDVFEHLTSYAINHPLIKKNCNVIFGDATTVHSLSQLPLLNLGFSFTGFTFNEKPGSAYRMDVGIDNAARLSYAEYYLIYNKKELDIYLPTEIEELVKCYIKDLELKRNILTPIDVVTDKSDFKHNIDVRANYSNVLFESVGTDFKEVLDQIDYENKTNLICTSDILLPLSDSETILLYNYAREKGYFFTEYIPQTDLGDFIKMQRFYTGTVNYDRISLPDNIYPYLEITKSFNKD